MKRIPIAVLAMVLAFGVPATALADCASDIDKVENAIDNTERSGIDVTVAEKMRVLLDEATKEHRAGNEAKCQDLINQAKYMGNVE
ncbi:hypothetical protein [Labrenzia sp. OB1]|uniref:hypothetical protein n=1 Tax=Labrenzia sp. OB1 TaxID=1561204 RepID=UPI000A7B2B3C|nr:hypothetical protein [Labrenzia sp. OB1]